MRIFISADIEGCAGFARVIEGDQGHREYEYFRGQMTREVCAACEGARKAGATEFLIRDAHGTACNLLPDRLPEEARLLRGVTGSVFAMMCGADRERFDACLMIGYHSGVGSGGSPVAHTFNRQTDAIRLNGAPLSEFLFNAYTASYLGVPVAFISGDEALCRFAEAHLPGLKAVATQAGRGRASISINPRVAERRIRDGVYGALLSGAPPVPALPERFEMDIRFRDPADALFNSAYAGIDMLDDKTLRYASGDWLEVLRMVHFVLDK